MTDKDVEKLEQEIADRKAKIAEINKRKDLSKAKLLDLFLLSDLADKDLPNKLNQIAQKLSKTDRQNLATVYEFITVDKPTTAPQTPPQNTPQGYTNTP